MSIIQEIEDVGFLRAHLSATKELLESARKYNDIIAIFQFESRVREIEDRIVYLDDTPE